MLEEPVQTVWEYVFKGIGKNMRRSGEPQNSTKNDPRQTFTSNQNRETPGVDGNGKRVEQPAAGQQIHDYRTRFYKIYCQEAEDYDKELKKKYDKDLKITLIFAGLCSAVASAFIIRAHSRFQPDLKEETATLARCSRCFMPCTVPHEDFAVPMEYASLPPARIEVHAILYASLVASLLAASLAMLGKRCLNQYVSIDVQLSTIERCQNRQRKLDGLVAWYFCHVMDSLPLVLQAAILLLSFALSRYLWDTNTTVALVVLGVTSFGILPYFFTVVAGAASVCYPFQTTGPRILQLAVFAVISASRNIFRLPRVFNVLRVNIAGYSPWQCGYSFKHFLKAIKCGITSAFAVGVSHFGRETVWFLAAFVRGAYARLFSISPPYPGSDRENTSSDLRCISWILQMSRDEAARLSTMEYLGSITTLADFDPTLVIFCFSILLDCVNVVDGRVVVTQGSGRLAKISVLCLLRTLSHLSATDPTSNVLVDLRQRYNKALPSSTDFTNLPFYHIFGAVHVVFHPCGRHQRFGWGDYNPSSSERAVVAQAFAKLAQFEYRRSGRRMEVPRWILCFVLNSLSLNSPPPTPIIVDCLSIIAIDLGCDISCARNPPLDENAQMDRISWLINQKLETMIQAGDPKLLDSKRKPITAFFPYTVWRKQDGQHEMLGTFLRASRASKKEEFMWNEIKPLIVSLLDEDSPVSLKEATILASPHLPWSSFKNGNHLIRLWAAAASAVPYTDDIGQSVVDALLQNAFWDWDSLPVGIWSWLNKRPLLPTICHGRHLGSCREIVQMIRALGDIKTLTSYLLVVWSEWDGLWLGGFEEMYASIREDFNGVAAAHHREDLVLHLDRVLEELDRGLRYFQQHNPNLCARDIRRTKLQYMELREVLLRVDREQRLPSPL